MGIGIRWMVAASMLLGGHLHAAEPKVKAFALQPEPAQKDTVESQLKRYKGQSSFLNYEVRYFGGPERAVPAAGKSAADGGQRAQQESDVYKVGKEGSKLLYLLNNYRGLQVVSFADGADKAKLLGRVEATGNYPDDMYYDAAKDQMIVLERNWYDSDNESSYSENQSRILVYNVANPEKPALDQEIPIEGEIADSRIVGEVLYVATSVRPSYYSSPYSERQEPKGLVYSFLLTQKGPREIQKQALTLPASRRENMNIVEVKEGDAYKYYLVAVLSDSRWGWWDRKSLVEVIDISDPKGVIKPLMVASAKGSVNERSQTTIKDGTLIVTSNFFTEGDGDDRNVAQIAVETFILPDAASQTMTERQYNILKLQIEEALDKVPAKEKSAAFKRLVKEMGLQGKFVAETDNPLKKVVSDAEVTLQDSTGLSASLQDVRYSGDRLYVFWVPANQVDPFDLIDISKPKEGIKHLARLQFEGWIQRAIPVQYKNHEYILGLGEEIPGVDNEERRRHAKAMLFEVRQSGEKFRQDVVAEMRLADANFWTRFNGQDKEIEVRFSDESKGTILFQGSKYDERRYMTGGKLVGFDLAAAADGQFDQVFQEGSFLAADQNWLRRVFQNSEIEKVNTFSDEQLATYDVTQIGSPDAVATALGILELAHNVASYVVLKSPAGNLGIQVISDYRYSWYEDTSEMEGETELRVVDVNKADSEVAQVSTLLKVPGSYTTHLIDRVTGNLLVMSSSSRSYVKEGETHYTYETTNYLTQFNVLSGETGPVLNQQGQVKWTSEEARDDGFGWYYSGSSSLVQTDKDQILALSSNDLRVLTLGAELKEQKLTLANCSVEGRENYGFTLVSGQLMMTSKQYQDDEKAQGRYSRNFVSSVELGATEATCGVSLNIPGEPVAILEGNLVTNDERVTAVSYKKSEDPNERPEVIVKTEQSLISLKLDGTLAVLKDDYELANKSIQEIKTLGKNQIFFVQTQGERYGYRGPYWNGAESSSKIVRLSLDGDGDFLQNDLFLDYLDVKGSRLSLAGVYPDPRNAGGWLALVSNGREVDVLSWKDSDGFAVNESLIPVDERFNKASEAQASVVLPSYFYSYGEAQNVGFEPEALRFNVSLGSAGVKQLYLK